MRILVVVADALHLGYLGCYGNEWIETPHLDRLAAEAVVFDRHYADRPDAAGARLAWRTGCYQLPAPDEAAPRAATAVDLLHALRAGGVRTCLVRDRAAPPDDPFAAGWDHVADAGEAADALPAALARCGALLDDLATADPWLLWLELSTPLPPWTVPEDFRWMYFQAADRPDPGDNLEGPAEEPPEPTAELTPGFLAEADVAAVRRLQDSYAGAVSYLDAGLGQLREELRARDLEGQTWLIVTTNHGLALGEHGMVGPHRPWLHDELVHLPLLVRLPGGAEAGRRVFALTQPVDLFPTLLDAFALPVPPVHGNRLGPLLHDDQTTVRPYAVSGLSCGGSLEWALRTPEWSFLLPLRVPEGDGPRGPQLYVQPDDRWEVNNVVQHHPALAEHLEQVVRAFVDVTQGPGPLQAPPLRDVEAEPAAAVEATPEPSGGQPP